ncbi:MAG: anhydro-N-acetylmuramic acid kinase [Gemmatimonadales bacterium]
MTERAPVLAVGLMSGTSLDGVTGALVRIEEPAEGDFRLTLQARRTIPYGQERERRIASAIAGGTAREIALLHADLGEWLAECVETLLDDAGVAPASVAFIASHGQTIWHEPRKASLQLGNPAVIAERTGIAVIADFRSRDVAAGGEGAPLVPRADRLLFAGREGPRALLNIGGIANITLVPKRGDDSPLLAFDTGPGVMVIDACTQRLFNGLRYDEGGRIAASGRALDPVLKELLADPFFAGPPPRSTGRERFGATFADALLARCRTLSDQPADAIATATELTARAIGRATRFIPASLKPRDVVRSGGGARNPTLVAALQRTWPGVEHRSFDDLFFDGDAKEAAAFAFLGYLTFTGRPGNEPGATGAAGPRVLGSITPA